MIWVPWRLERAILCNVFTVCHQVSADRFIGPLACSGVLCPPHCVLGDPEMRLALLPEHRKDWPDESGSCCAPQTSPEISGMRVLSSSLEATLRLAHCACRTARSYPTPHPDRCTDKQNSRATAPSRGRLFWKPGQLYLSNMLHFYLAV